MLSLISCRSDIFRRREPRSTNTAPALPRGAVRGCSYLKWRVEGRFFLSPGWSPTPPKSMLNRLSSSRGSPWCFFFFERIRFQDFFIFWSMVLIRSKQKVKHQSHLSKSPRLFNPHSHSNLQSTRVQHGDHRRQDRPLEECQKNPRP